MEILSEFNCSLSYKNIQCFTISDSSLRAKRRCRWACWVEAAVAVVEVAAVVYVAITQPELAIPVGVALLNDAADHANNAIAAGWESWLLHMTRPN